MHSAFTQLAATQLPTGNIILSCHSKRRFFSRVPYYNQFVSFTIRRIVFNGIKNSHHLGLRQWQTHLRLI